MTESEREKVAGEIWQLLSHDGDSLALWYLLDMKHWREEDTGILVPPHSGYKETFVETVCMNYLFAEWDYMSPEPKP